MEMFSTIVVAVDFSDVSTDVLRYAARLQATSPGARLHVLHVVPDPLHEPWTVEAVGVDFAQMTRDWIAEAERRLADMVAAEHLGGATVTPAVVVGRAAEGIVECARGLSADLIVMGTHGYGPITRFMLGSVAERVLRLATCPVVTLPPHSVRTTPDAA